MLNEINTFREKKMDNFVLYANLFLKDKENTYRRGYYRISHENGIEEKGYTETWNKMDECDGERSKTFISDIKNKFTKEGIKILEMIEGFDKQILVPRQKI